MKLDIRTSATEPRRQTYAYLARRFGEDRPATRYEEAVYDLQSTENFHYRPEWEPEFELWDKARTAIVLQDWYVLLDPRQFYYATYNISRTSLEVANGKAFDFAEKQGLLEELTPEARKTVEQGILPMRHYEWGANRVLWSMCDRGYGSAVTSAAAFAAMDRLGCAQIITRLALALDGQTATSLEPAKKQWLEEPSWQGVRNAVEDTFVMKDWFESFVAQVALDGIVHRLVFDDLRAKLRKHGGTGLVMVTDFPAEIYADQARWIDAVLKIAAAESAANRDLLTKWAKAWTERAVTAAKPLASYLLADDTAPEKLGRDLTARFAKLGIGEVKS